MNKKEIIAEIKEETGLKNRDIEAVVKAYGKVIIAALANGDSVRHVGFGTYTTVERAARKVKSPYHKEPIDVPAHKAPVFRFGKAVKALIR